MNWEYIISFILETLWYLSLLFTGYLFYRFFKVVLSKPDMGDKNARIVSNKKV